MNKHLDNLSDDVLTEITGGTLPSSETPADEVEEEAPEHKCHFCAYDSETPGDLALHNYFAHMNPDPDF
jgi:hypothetical protein